MLTNNDLGKIKKIIHDGIKPVQIDVTGLKIDVKSLKTNVKSLEANITGLKKDVKKIRKNVDIIIDSFGSGKLVIKSTGIPCRNPSPAKTPCGFLIFVV